MKCRHKVAVHRLPALLCLGISAALAAAFPAAAYNGKIPVLRHITGTYRGAAETAADRQWTFCAVNDRAFTLSAGGDTLHFENGKRTARFQKQVIYLNFPPLRDNTGRWFLHVQDIEKTAAALLAPPPPQPIPRRIVIDPGHGGKDPGARGTKLLEKDQNLIIARSVAKILQERGFDIVMTRSDDRTRSLAERPQEITRTNADLFVSIHQNADPRKRGVGIETFVATPAHCSNSTAIARTTGSGAVPGNRFDRQSLQLASRVQEHLIRATGSVDRGVKRSRFVVIRDADCPAILIECGFITTPAEQQKMLDPAWCRKIAAAIADGITAYARPDAAKTGSDQ